MRLIDADALLKEFEENEKALIENGFAPQLVDSDIVAVYVNQQPTIEAKPVVHAHWINDPAYKSFDGKWKKGQECSACGAYFVSDAIKPYSNHPYCSECGAQMDEEAEDD